MTEILKQNISADKNGLYRAMAFQCGTNRLTQPIVNAFDSALLLLRDRIEIDGYRISLIENPDDQKFPCY